MSIAVRVSVWILGVLVAVSAAVAVMTLIQKQTVEGQNQSLRNNIAANESKLAELTAKAKKLEDGANELSDKISKAQEDKSEAQSQYEELKQKSDDLQAQLDQANSDRDDWKARVDTITRERNGLMEKLKNQPTKIVYKERVVQTPSSDSSTGSSAAPVDVTSNQGDQYWAAVLKQKAALQVEVDKQKAALDQAALQLVDLKKQNSDLELHVKQLRNEKDEIIQKIKYGQDLADNLSIDLARSRNDQQVVVERANKLKEENLQLLGQIRELNSTKLQLEKTVSRLTDDKDAMQKKLVETESIIQSRIDDIWKIKQGLDRKLAENSSQPASAVEPSTASGSMELPPIIVNAPNNVSNQQQSVAAQVPAAAPVGKTEGNIISINESNNFVIVDLGQQNSTIGIGNVLKVYRNSNKIATLEVIQVRRDICAADIKDKTTVLKVGDSVRFN